MNFNKLKPKISSLVSNSNVLDETLQAICDLLKVSVCHYDWVGFYFRNGEKKNLKLDRTQGRIQITQLSHLEKGFVGKWLLVMKTLW
tara:strand:- start:54 stop:314 length:261 start_codon:yes stop_codon:yes gene_type:complete